MADNNSEKIDNLVDPKALEQLKSLDIALDVTYNQMVKLLKPTVEIEKALTKSSVTYKELIDTISKYEGIQKQVESVQKNQKGIEEQIVKTKTDAINKTRDQSKELENLSKRISDSGKASQDAEKGVENWSQSFNRMTVTVKGLSNSLKELENRPKLTDIAASVNKSSMLTGASNEGASRLAALNSLQSGYNQLLEQGHISLQQYNGAMDRLVVVENDVINGMQLANEKISLLRDNTQSMGNQAAESFGSMTPRVQQLLITLTELSKEQSSLKEYSKQLEESYKSGAITLDTYIQKKAELAASEYNSKKASSEATTELKLQIQLANSAKDSYNYLSAQYGLNKIELNRLTESQRAHTKEFKELEKETLNIRNRMNQMQRNTGDNSLSVGNYLDKIREALGLNGKFGESLVNLAKSGQGFNTVLSGLKNNIVAFGKTLLTLLANPVFLTIAGLASVGIAFKFWFDYNKGLMEATALTKQFTGLAGEEMKGLRNEVTAVADAYGKNFKDVLLSTNTVAKQFGITHQEALQVVRDGFVSGADASGNFLNVLSRYSVAFKEAGFSASEFVAIATQTVDSGVFSDKGMNAIQMASTRIREMKKPAKEALDAIGLSSVVIEKGLREGSISTIDVINQISEKIESLNPSSKEVGRIMSDVFGRQGKEAGIEFVKGLKDMTTELDVVKERAGLLAKLADDQIEANLRLQNVVSALFDQTGGTFESMYASAKIFVTDGLTSIIKGLIDVINYFVRLYNDSIAFRYVVQSVKAAFIILFDVAMEGLTYLIDTIKVLGDMLYAAFNLDMQGINQAWIDWGNRTMKIVGNISTSVKNNVNNALDAVNGEKIKPIEIPVIAKSNYKAGNRNGGDLGGDDGEEDPKAAKERLKREEAERKAAQDLAEFRAKQSYEADKKIVDNEKAAYEQRLDYLDIYTSKQKEAIDLAAENQIFNLKKSEMTERAYHDSIALINEKAQAERNKIDEEGTKIRLSLAKDNAEKLIKAQADLLSVRNQEIEQAEQEGLLKASSAYKQGLISAEKYEQAKVDITRKASMELYDAEIDSLQKSLEATGITEEQKKALTEKLGEARIDYQKYVNEVLISNEEKYRDVVISIQKEIADKRKELISSSLDFVSTLFSAKTEKQLSELDKESEANSKFYDEEQEKVERLATAGAITDEQAAARKAYLAQQEEDQENRLAEQRKDIQTKQAVFEKALAVARIGIEAAMAVAKIKASIAVGIAAAAAMSPLTLGQPWAAAIAAQGAVSIGTTIAAAAIQAATVLAAPIPQYAHGTKDHKGGLAEVGDGGRHEMAITPDGKIYKTPKTSTLVDLPAHTIVKPDFDKAIESMAIKHTIIPISDNKTIIISENKEQIKYAKNTIAVLNKVVSSNNAVRQNQVYSNNINSLKRLGRS